MYQVLARKWRPQSFDTLVGQKHVTRTLGNAITSSRLAHAYIFAGLRGTGKTTVARILAKCLNCEQGTTVTPCGECAACSEIAESRAMDVLEIDAASRTKVEQTRELLEMVSYAPVRDRYKILIIDEAHMLSKASFNALLKTLEEPPPNVIFLLATTELQKVLPTILSRCQVFEFRRVGVREVADHLRRICEDEKLEISDLALERIARAGEGSVRDSLSVLERVLAFCGKEVDDDDVLRIVGGVRSTVLTQLIAALAQRDAAAMLTVLDGLVDEGHDLLHFWNEFLGAMRDLLLLRSIPDRPELLSRSPEEAQALHGAAGDLSREDLSRAFQILADLEPALKSSSQPRFMFEAALIRLAGLGAVRPIEELLERMAGTPARHATEKKSAEVAGPAPAPAPPAATATLSADADLRGKLVASVLEAKPMVGTILGQAASITLEDDRVAIAFSEAHENLARPLQRKENLGVLERHARKLAGRPVNVRVELGSEPTPQQQPPQEQQQQRSHEQRKPHPSRPPRSGTPRRSKRGDLLEDAKQEPGVKKLLRDFGAQVVEIQPLDQPGEIVPNNEGTGPMKESP